MKQFWKPPYHIFLRTQVSRYQWHLSLQSLQKLFLNVPKLYTLGFSLCTEQFLRKCNDFMVILYNFWNAFHCWLFFVERPWSKNHPKKKYMTFCLTLWYEKIWSKEPLQCTYDIIIHRSLLRALETKPVSFYMINNLIYETKVRGVAKLLKAHVKK